MKRVVMQGILLLSGAMMLGGGVTFGSDVLVSEKTGQATLSLEDAIAAAKVAYPGQVLEAELEQENGQQVFEVTIVGTDGHTHEVDIDSRTGKIVGSEVETDDEHQSDKNE